MEQAPDPQIVKKFLSKVIAIEESYAFEKKGQESARKEEIQSALDELSK